MKIGVIHWAFYPMIGGVETHLLTIFPEVVKQGAQVSLLTASVEGAKDEEDLSGIKVIRRKEMFPPNIAGWEKEGRDLYKIAKDMFSEFIRSQNIDVVQVHNCGMDFYGYSKALHDVCGRLKIPAYTIIHNDVFMPAKEPLMWKILELPWAAYVPISDFISERMRTKRPDLAKRKWVTILHGLDLERFKPVDETGKEKLRSEFGFSGKKIVLHTGRLLHTKGAYETMQALPEIRTAIPETLLVVLGKSAKMVFEADIKNAYYKKVDELIKKENLEPNIWFGEFPYPQMHKIINASDVVVAPTVEALEPCGLCPMEAMACGKPVVVTRSGGLRESVVDNVTGFIIDRDPAVIPGQLAKRVIELFSNPQLAGEMGQKGTERAKKLYDKKRMAKDFISLSKELRHGDVV